MSRRDPLLAQLAGQRAHVLGAIDGLTDEQLRRSVLPSGWSCLGLLRHLAVSDERYWFTTVVGGAPLDFPEGDGADWAVGPDERAEDVIDLYRSEIDRSDAALAAVGLDDPPAWTDPDWETWGVSFPTVRHVVAHVLVETAVHAGHLDATRELLDGRQWLVM